MRRTLKEIEKTAGAIGRFVRERRNLLGYTQDVLAQRSGVGLRFLKELELGKESIRLDKALQVIEFVGGELHIRVKDASEVRK